jgi:hypothetical protein
MDHADLIKLKTQPPLLADVYRPIASGAPRPRLGVGLRRTHYHYRELLAWKDVDAVIIATPDFGPIILKVAVEAGKDAYVEKPARRLSRARRRTGGEGQQAVVPVSSGAATVSSWPRRQRSGAGNSAR